MTLYQNGEVVGSADMVSDIRDIDLTEEYERTAEGLQKFYLGRSYANNRDFCGLMSEVRVWNRALSAAEINAENHFYTVDPNSEGLVAYWNLQRIQLEQWHGMERSPASRIAAFQYKSLGPVRTFLRIGFFLLIKKIAQIRLPDRLKC